MGTKTSFLAYVLLLKHIIIMIIMFPSYTIAQLFSKKIFVVQCMSKFYIFEKSKIPPKDIPGIKVLT